MFKIILPSAADAISKLICSYSRKEGTLLIEDLNPVMAMTRAVVIAQVDQIVEAGTIDPEHVITAGIFVQRVVASVDTASARTG